MLELRILALVGLFVTVIVSSLAVTGAATLAQRIQRARHAPLERGDSGRPAVEPARTALASAPLRSGADDPPAASLERRVRNRQAEWRLRC